MSRLLKNSVQKQGAVTKRANFSFKLNHFGSLLLLSVLMLFSACKKEKDTIVLIDQEEFNAEERQIISQELHEAISEETGTFKILNPLSNPGVTAFYEYLDRAYQSLVNTEQVVNRDKLTWSIYILKDNEVKNIFTTPGGAMYISTGMLKTIKAEHELINLLAHETMYIDSGLLLEKLKSDYGGDVLYQIIAGKSPPELGPMAKALPDIAYTEAEVLLADSYAVDIICDFYTTHTGCGIFSNE